MPESQKCRNRPKAVISNVEKLRAILGLTLCAKYFWQRIQYLLNAIDLTQCNLLYNRVRNCLRLIAYSILLADANLPHGFLISRIDFVK